ncbi:MAG: AcrR family transcriptional regulator [Paracoccaceae bacterium]|jgi:AcrR family transcriptional regulator
MLIPQLVSEGLLTEPNSAKGRLLAASAALFKQKGFSRTTVRDIAAEVGILSGSIFHHFTNKESILRTIMVEAIYLVFARMKLATADLDSCVDKMHALLRCELEAIHGLNGIGFTLLSAEWRFLSDDSQAEILKLRSEYEEFHRNIYAEAKALGHINVEPFFMRHFVRGALVETVNWYHLDGDLPLEGLVEQIYLTTAVV